MTGEKELSASLLGAWQIEEHKSLQRKKIRLEISGDWLHMANLQPHNHMPHLSLLQINESAYPLIAQGHW